MKTINVDLSSGEALNLLVGRQGESGVTQVVFDFSALKTEFGTGTVSLSVKRPKEPTPYAQTITVDGTDATWLVNETDTGVAGCGEIQLTYTLNSQIAKTVVFKYTVYPSIGVDGEYPIPGQTWQQEIEEDIADIKEDLADLQNNSGVTAELKSALLDIASKIAYENAEDGAVCYQNLYDALYPNASSISCVYTQTGTVYITDTLDSLKDDLVVTAHYSDSTTRTLKPSDYTLTGTLTAGISTIIVHYGNLTTTFTVIVTTRTLLSISAVYTQSETVYTDDDLDSLKSDLVVTATYSDSSTEIVPSADYELSGTLASGTSTITVTYESKTTTFTVNNVVAPLYSIPDFEEQTITINTNRYAKVKKENGVYTYKATGADVAYIYPDGTVHNSRSTNEWIVTPADKPISNQVLDLTYNNPGSSATNFATKYSQPSATSNLASAQFSIAANTSGHEDFIAFENNAYPERHFSGFCIQMESNVNYEKTATFKMRLFCDGVRYL